MEPKRAGDTPIRVELEGGKNYAWCSCGESTNQPFCDGKHKGTGFTPTMISVPETKTVSVCTCKVTANPGFCDGSHKA